MVSRLRGNDKVVLTTHGFGPRLTREKEVGAPLTTSALLH